MHTPAEYATTEPSHAGGSTVTVRRTPPEEPSPPSPQEHRTPVDCAPTGPSHAGATTEAARRTPPRAHSRRSPPTAMTVPVGYAPTGPSHAGAPTTLVGRWCPPEFRCKPSPPAASIPADCAPTGPSLAGATMMAAERTLPLEHSAPSPPGLPFLRAAHRRLDHMLGPQLPRTDRRTHRGIQTATTRQTHPKAPSPPSARAKTTPAGCAQTTPSSVGAVGRFASTEPGSAYQKPDDDILIVLMLT